jgi:hypothetical protein
MIECPDRLACLNFENKETKKITQNNKKQKQ